MGAVSGWRSTSQDIRMAPTSCVDLFDDFSILSPPMSPLSTIKPSMDILSGENNLYTDINDIDLDLGNMNFDLDWMDDMMDECINFPLIDNLQDTEPLRQDCMWGGENRFPMKRKDGYTFHDMAEAKKVMVEAIKPEDSLNLSSSPLLSSSSFLFTDLNCLDTPFNTVDSTTETDEEVDVVTDDGETFNMIKNDVP